ncbi:TetR/AcrR family transcriptional regulator [Albibacterium profundi]|uniref:TetR/AcrR family transcriptional regulator n=1 Tax=Albibacterium profundi TaxID=3134906 RepID=A0ABV5CA56_9SPHI
MGIKERKERHKEDLKQKILDAAKSLFMKHGYEATSIRKIAAEIEFSPTTIYLYYKDKNDVLYALHREGFKMLSARFSALTTVDDPFERLKAMGRTYIKFALEHRDFYELMFVMKEPLQFLNNQCVSVDWEEGKQSFEYLMDTITDCQKYGYFADQNPELFSMFVWSTVHGFCTLSLHGHFDHIVENNHIEYESNDLLTLSINNFFGLMDKLK